MNGIEEAVKKHLEEQADNPCKKVVECPDCKAELIIKSKSPLPDDLEIEFSCHKS